MLSRSRSHSGTIIRCLCMVEQSDRSRSLTSPTLQRVELKQLLSIVHEHKHSRADSRSIRGWHGGVAISGDIRRLKLCPGKMISTQPSSSHLLHKSFRIMQINRMLPLHPYLIPQSSLRFGSQQGSETVEVVRHCLGCGKGCRLCLL